MATPAGDFVLQFKALCYFTNGTQRVRLVVRHLYNLEEYVRYDSEVGEFRALTPLGLLDAEYWNGQKDLLERERAYVDTLCRYNYQLEAPATLQRRGECRLTPRQPGSISTWEVRLCNHSWALLGRGGKTKGEMAAGPTGDLRGPEGDGRGPRTGTWIGTQRDQALDRGWHRGAAPSQTRNPPSP